MKQKTNHNTFPQNYYDLDLYSLKVKVILIKNGAKIHKYFPYLRYLKWIFTGELVWIVVIAYQTFFPVIQFQKMLPRAVSKNNEGQGQRSKGTTVIMT